MKLENGIRAINMDFNPEGTLEMSMGELIDLANNKNAAMVSFDPSGKDGLIIFIPRGFREQLPKKRRSTNYKGRVGENNVFVTIGEYSDGRPAEIFIDVAKEGAALRSFATLCARLITKSFQYGIPVEEICDTLTGYKFEPSGLSDSPLEEITDASSIPDYLGKLLRQLYVEIK